MYSDRAVLCNGCGDRLVWGINVQKLENLYQGDLEENPLPLGAIWAPPQTWVQFGRHLKPLEAKEAPKFRAKKT